MVHVLFPAVHVPPTKLVHDDALFRFPFGVWAKASLIEITLTRATSANKIMILFNNIQNQSNDLRIHSIFNIHLICSRYL